MGVLIVCFGCRKEKLSHAFAVRDAKGRLYHSAKCLTKHARKHKKARRHEERKAARLLAACTWRCLMTTTRWIRIT